VSNPIEKTEIKLAEKFSRKHAILTGRGAGALYAVCHALRQPASRLVLPSVGCPSLLGFNLSLGIKPVVVDVNSNMGMDIDCLNRVIREGDIVVGVHLYGIPVDADSIRKICDNAGAVFIEDAAQAIGGRDVGTLGLAGVLSFAGGKILGTSGGGAVLTDDDDVAAKVRVCVGDYPDRPEDLNNRAKILRNKITVDFNHVRSSGDRSPAANWRSYASEAGDIYRYKITDSEAENIFQAVDDLGEVSRNRRRKVDRYRFFMDGFRCLWLEYPTDCSPFRFSFILPLDTPGEVQEATEAIRSAGLHASNLYLPLQWLDPGNVEDTGCPNGEYMSMRVINLWVDEATSETDIRKAAGMVSMWAS
jgi:dTDP-4-amino-4,6-dideoxygalactose transaminase